MAVVDAAEIRIRAERRIGELMKAQKDAGLMATGTAGTGNANVTGGLKKNPPEPKPITLAEVGIDKGLADRACRRLQLCFRLRPLALA